MNKEIKQSCSMPNVASIQNNPLLQRLLSSKWVKHMHSPHVEKNDYVHPCVIDGYQTLVYDPDLPQRSPETFNQLKSLAENESFALMADRRIEKRTVFRDRRSAWLPVFALALGLQAEVMAGGLDKANISASTTPETQQTLALYDTALPLPNPSEYSATNHNLHDEDIITEELFNPQVAEIEGILMQHYRPDSDDPSYVVNDLREMAEYFSRFPASVELLTSIKDQPWRLSYDKDTFETQVRGSQLQVQSVTVSFDTRAAAQLRSHRACETKRGACIASPADALLHELLHAQSALLESDTFIAQGGMNSVIYPYAHEHGVIKSENKLYKSMTALDGVYRPHRSSHTGRIAASSCATCIQ